MRHIASMIMGAIVVVLAMILPAAASNATYQQVRMADLLSHPDAYDNKPIQIVGVFRYALADNWLYPSREAAAALDRRQAIRLKINWAKAIEEEYLKPMDNRVVAIAGEFHFDGSSPGDGAMHFSDVMDITSLPCGLHIFRQNGLFGINERPCAVPN
jgi:hypothetical protein